MVMVYSASNYAANVQFGDSFYFAKKQLVGFLLGCIGMVVASKFDYRFFQKKRVRYLGLGVSVVLLALVFVPGLGQTNYGATRWIGVAGVTLQPSEIAKYALVIFSAGYMSENMGKMREFKGMFPVLIAGGVICVLIILEPNMSVTMCVGMIMIAMLFLGGVKIADCDGTLSIVTLERLSRSLGVSKRRRVSIDSIVICFRKRGMVWYGFFSVTPKIPFFTVCRKRFYSCDYRGRNGVRGDFTFVSRFCLSYLPWNSNSDKK